MVSIQLCMKNCFNISLWFHFLKSHIYVIMANNICFRFPINRNIKNQNCIVASTIFLTFAGNLNFALQSTEEKKQLVFWVIYIALFFFAKFPNAQLMCFKMNCWHIVTSLTCRTCGVQCCSFSQFWNLRKRMKKIR